MPPLFMQYSLSIFDETKFCQTVVTFWERFIFSEKGQIL